MFRKVVACLTFILMVSGPVSAQELNPLSQPDACARAMCDVNSICVVQADGRPKCVPIDTVPLPERPVPPMPKPTWPPVPNPGVPPIPHPGVPPFPTPEVPPIPGPVRPTFPFPVTPTPIPPGLNGAETPLEQ